MGIQNHINKKLYITVHPDTFEIRRPVLIGASGLNEKNFPLANFELLKADVYFQKALLKMNCHPDGYLIPWGNKDDELVVVSDGIYKWDEISEDYKMIS